MRLPCARIGCIVWCAAAVLRLQCHAQAAHCVANPGATCALTWGRLTPGGDHIWLACALQLHSTRCAVAHPECDLWWGHRSVEGWHAGNSLHSVGCAVVQAWVECRGASCLSLVHVQASAVVV
jgi:hypothetical protein